MCLKKMLFPTLHMVEELFPYFSKLPISINTRNQSWHLHNEINIIGDELHFNFGAKFQR